MERDEHLMAVLLGESAPPGSADGDGDGDGEGRAAAERDMALVREQLHRIGDGLAGAAPAAPDPAGRGRRLRRRALFALAASVAAVLLGTGAAYLASGAGGAGDSGSEARLTDEALLACSTAVAEGTVARVESLGGEERFRIVLDVERSYRPAAGKPRLVFTAEGAEVREYYRTGARMLVVVSGIPGEGPQTYRAGDPAYDDGESAPARDALDWGRQWVQRTLPAAQGQECPAN
ncbi:hypothetical protein ACIO1C_07500 [Streptomyces sp. NPDC087420]|uniref:hypothetical protein n=1 Tax=Streptomyces sp. NPDC087420 TaxID=3365785 RepID=UPI003837C5FC